MPSSVPNLFFNFTLHPILNKDTAKILYYVDEEPCYWVRDSQMDLYYAPCEVGKIDDRLVKRREEILKGNSREMIRVVEAPPGADAVTSSQFRRRESVAQDLGSEGRLDPAGANRPLGTVDRAVTGPPRISRASVADAANVRSRQEGILTNEEGVKVLDRRG